ncbi:hypothetical protein PUN28_006576 [Cardiocondyla obscurior]|uniref:Uncharacterized protein n=1 Tax=Cardiocondyla obscurior TaxID=286306 RepID=A0AAW2GAY6_9HYME
MRGYYFADIYAARVRFACTSSASDDNDEDERRRRNAFRNRTGGATQEARRFMAFPELYTSVHLYLRREPLSSYRSLKRLRGEYLYGSDIGAPPDSRKRRQKAS